MIYHEIAELPSELNWICPRDSSSRLNKASLRRTLGLPTMVAEEFNFVLGPSAWSTFGGRTRWIVAIFANTPARCGVFVLVSPDCAIWNDYVLHFKVGNKMLGPSLRRRQF
jgi:hypothetical protein